MFHLANKLNKIDDFEVGVFCLKKYQIYPMDIDGGVEVNPFKINSKIVKRLLKIKSSGKESNINRGLFDSFSKIFKSNNVVKSILKKIDSFFFNEPGFLTGIIGFIWFRELIKNKKFIDEVLSSDAVIISGPPFSIFSLGPSIKKIKGSVKVIHDYRDPWNLWHDNNRLTWKREKNFLKSVDHIVTATRTVKADTITKFSIPDHKVSTIPNGANPQFTSKKYRIGRKKYLNSQNIYEICYAGAITINDSQKDSYRDFSLIYNYLENNANKIRFKIIGVTNLDSDEVKKLKSKFGDSIKFIPELEPIKAFEQLLSSDILFLPHITNDSSSKYIISGKFYDYLCARRPILSIGDNSSLHSQLVHEFKNGIHASADQSSLKIAINSLTKDYIKYYNACVEIDTSVFNRDIINEKYIKLLKSL